MKNGVTTPPAWLIDSSIYVFKAWFTRAEEQTDIHGNPINAVLGFIDFAYRLLSNESPQRIAFAFDESLNTSHRKEIFPEYKANRASAPESLRVQFQLCRSFIELFGIYQEASQYYEADDLIGTWARSLREENIPVNIITADKDLTQLIYEDDHWWEYNRGQKLDAKAIHKKFRVKPRQIADQLAIAGDKSDNIPGVPGVGMATAARLLKKFDNIENMLAQAKQISTMQIRKAKLIQESIIENQNTIKLARKLTGIACNIQEINTRQFTISEMDKDAFLAICRQLNLTEDEQYKWIKLHRTLLTRL